jgi:ComF family protein
MPLAALDLLLPPACAACGRLGEPLCGTCRRALEPAGRTEDAFVTPDPGAVIGEALTLAIAAFAYEGTLRRALGRLKYAGAARVAVPLAGAALPALSRLLAVSGPAPLVPVPLHRLRERERGYNQAALLACELGRLSGLPVARLLVRARTTTRQHHLDRAERLANLRDAFAAENVIPMPAVVIVVDDILTTSATLEACAGILRAVGVAAVYGFAIAREV